jgi:hypothetical protein
MVGGLSFNLRFRMYDLRFMGEKNGEATKNQKSKILNQK